MAQPLWTLPNRIRFYAVQGVGLVVLLGALALNFFYHLPGKYVGTVDMGALAFGMWTTRLALPYRKPRE